MDEQQGYPAISNQTKELAKIKKELEDMKQQQSSISSPETAEFNTKTDLSTVNNEVDSVNTRVDSVNDELKSVNNELGQVNSEINDFNEDDAREPVPKKVVNPTVGPLFVSLKKFNEIKTCIAVLKNDSRELRNYVEHIKSSRDVGTELLKKTVNKMESIEKNVEDINSIIRI